MGRTGGMDVLMEAGVTCAVRRVTRAVTCAAATRRAHSVPLQPDPSYSIAWKENLRWTGQTLLLMSLLTSVLVESQLPASWLSACPGLQNTQGPASGHGCLAGAKLGGERATTERGREAGHQPRGRGSPAPRRVRSRGLGLPWPLGSHQYYAQPQLQQAVWHRERGGS